MIRHKLKVQFQDKQYKMMNKKYIKTMAEIFLKLYPESCKITGFKFDNKLSEIWFPTSEPKLSTGNPSFNGNQENGLHESALSNNPPSGIRFDTENDGTFLQSLGVHEH